MANFTPQQIEEFLREFFDVVGTRQYIGARYIPVFGRPGESSIAWDNTAPYEPLTIVTYQGNSYTSRQYVPTGVDILNTAYWVETANYNSQVEAYRREVLDLAETVDDIDERTQGIDGLFLTGKNIVFYGDSTVAGGNPAYPIVFGQISGGTVTNRAISGTSVSIGTNSFEQLINSATDLSDFDVLFFSYGINDWQNSVALGRAGYGNRFGDKLFSVLNTIQTKAPNIQIVGITSNYCHREWTDASNNYNHNRHGFTLEQYVNEMIRVCRTMAVPIIDLYHTLGINENNYQSAIDPSEGNIYVHPNQFYKNKTAKMIFDAFSNLYTYQQNRGSRNLDNIKAAYGPNTRIDLSNADIAAAYNTVVQNVTPPYLLLMPSQTYIINIPRSLVTPSQPLYFSGHVGKADYGTGTTLDVNCNAVHTLISTAGDFIIPITYNTPTAVTSISVTNTSDDVIMLAGVCVSYDVNMLEVGAYTTNLTQYIDTSLFDTGSYAYVIFDKNDGAYLVYHLVLKGEYTANTQLKVFSTNLWQLFDGIMHIDPCVWNESGVYQSFTGLAYTNRNFGNVYVRDGHGYGAGSTIDGEARVFPLNQYVAFN